MTAKTKKRSMILSMTACDNEKSLAVIYGEKLKQNKKDPTHIFIFERRIIDKIDVFEQTKQIDIE